MKSNGRAHEPEGFAVVETVLVLVIIAAIVGVGAYVMHQKNTDDAVLTTTSSGTLAPITATPGTTAAIEQITQQDAQSEEAVDNSGDAGVRQATNSVNTALSELGGAYNEANL